MFRSVLNTPLVSREIYSSAKVIVSEMAGKYVVYKICNTCKLSCSKRESAIAKTLRTFRFWDFDSEQWGDCCSSALEKNLGESYQPFKRQPHKMVKHTQAICRQQPTNFMSVFDHFAGLALKGLTWKQPPHTFTQFFFSELLKLTLFAPMSHFCTPWKRQKTFDFLMFSGAIEMGHLRKKG